MEWYHYVACFFAGLFLANGVPHFVQGISGNKFPTPFAKPPGKGLSPAVVNVLWGLLNLLVGYLLAIAGKVTGGATLSMGVLFIGALVMGIMLGNAFTKRQRDEGEQ